MTQVEFEKHLNAIKARKNEELDTIAGWQMEIKTKIAIQRQRLQEAELELTKLRAEQRGLAAKRVEVERKWAARLAQFKAENYGESREMENISDYALVKELAMRGWHGPIYNEREDMAEDHKEGVISKFNTHYRGPEIPVRLP